MHTNHRTITAIGVGTAALALMGSGIAPAATKSVTDPRNDTAMQRNGPDIVATSVTYGKRLVVKVTYSSGRGVSMGTITGANLKFKNGKAYTLQRHEADSGWQTPLTNEILAGGTSTRVRCGDIKSAMSSRQVTVSAPANCFKGSKGTKLKAQGFSFTYNFDSDETGWTKWVKQASDPKKGKKGKKGKKKKVTHKIIRLGESPITAVQRRDTKSGGEVRNTNAAARFSGLRCVGSKCEGATVIVTATVELQRRINGSWRKVTRLPAAGKDTVVAPTLARTFPNSTAVRYVWRGQAKLSKERASFKTVSDSLRVK